MQHLQMPLDHLQKSLQKSGTYQKPVIRTQHFVPYNCSRGCLGAILRTATRWKRENGENVMCHLEKQNTQLEFSQPANRGVAEEAEVEGEEFGSYTC